LESRVPSGEFAAVGINMYNTCTPYIQKNGTKKDGEVVEISRWTEFDIDKSIEIVNDIIEIRNLDLELGVPNEL